MVERLNRTLCKFLAKVTENIKDWDLNIFAILFAYRTKKHATTGYIPFHLVYGRQAILPIETVIPIDPAASDKEISLENSILQRAFELIEELPYQHNTTRENTIKSQKKQKVRFDSKIQKEEFEIGDKVWIQRKDIEASCSAKFEEKRIGPFIVKEKLNNSAYINCVQ